MPKLTLTNLQKTFLDGTVAVRNLTLSADENQIAILAGPDGSGKSSVFRLIMGLEKADQGTVMLDEEPILYQPGQNHPCVMISEHYALYPRMTVAQNMEFGLKIEHMEREAIKDRVREVAGLLGLQDLLDTNGADLSAAQTFWVVLGRAICRRPAVYLLDDPLLSLNPVEREEICHRLPAIQQKLKAVFLFATKDCNQAEALGGRVAVLREGGIIQSGMVQDVCRNPHTMFVASFFSSPPLNLVDIVPHLVDGILYFLIDHKGRAPENYAVGIRAEGYFSHDLAQDGRELTLGIRPSGICIDRESLDQYPDCAMEATVEEIERTPWHCLVLVEVDGHKLVMRQELSCPLEEGDVIQVAIRPDCLLLFDKMSGKTIA